MPDGGLQSTSGPIPPPPRAGAHAATSKIELHRHTKSGTAARRTVFNFNACARRAGASVTSGGCACCSWCIPANTSLGGSSGGSAARAAPGALPMCARPARRKSGTIWSQRSCPKESHRESYVCLGLQSAAPAHRRTGAPAPPTADAAGRTSVGSTRACALLWRPRPPYQQRNASASFSQRPFRRGDCQSTNSRQRRRRHDTVGSGSPTSGRLRTAFSPCASLPVDPTLAFKTKKVQTHSGHGIKVCAARRSTFFRKCRAAAPHSSTGETSALRRCNRAGWRNERIVKWPLTA